MKKYSFLGLSILVLLWGCSSAQKASRSNNTEVRVFIDLVNVKNDQVKVLVHPAKVTAATIHYQLPAIIPGTYALQNYGRYVVDFKAIDKTGKELPVTKTDANTWQIRNAMQLQHVEYWVNDTFDEEVAENSKPNPNVIFSPAGTNILDGENFLLNLGGFVGYFDQQQENLYQLTIEHPKQLVGTSALIDKDNSPLKDEFRISRYAELVDNPIMYAHPDIAVFNVGNMKVVLHVYSPRNKLITAEVIRQELEKVMVAQKAYLGPINQTKKYAILVYLTSLSAKDAQGGGALEHNQSTTATFEDQMKPDALNHVIAHEFFHTLTPLRIHSKEIHFFDFNHPKMSKHLWMYEGFTEYFASLFKVNKKLESEQAFFDLMVDKLELAQTVFKDDLSFLTMSQQIVDPTMNKQFGNVYSKGALMAMCMDIIIREKSNGKRSLLSVMGELAEQYGPNKPFDDDELIPAFTRLTYPEVGYFIEQHIANGNPVPYADYLSKVGVALTKMQQPVKMAFRVEDKTYFTIDPEKNKAIIQTLDGKNVFVSAMGFENGDEVVELNGYKVEGAEAAKFMLILGYKLKVGQPYTAKVIRKGNELTLTNSVKLNTIEAIGMKFVNEQKLNLKNQWLYQ